MAIDTSLTSGVYTSLMNLGLEQRATLLLWTSGQIFSVGGPRIVCMVISIFMREL
jgi:hypothetical protein